VPLMTSICNMYWYYIIIAVWYYVRRFQLSRFVVSVRVSFVMVSVVRIRGFSRGFSCHGFSCQDSWLRACVIGSMPWFPFLRVEH